MSQNRRRFMQALALGGAAYTTPGLFAEILKETVKLGDGPFYPDKMPLDTDNDLVLINESSSPSVGEITHLTGRLLTKSGEPIRNGFIEIWQTDVNGSYIHTKGRNQGKLDQQFQGYGRFLTDSKGQYYFRTIKPVQYTLNGTFRCPHIHVAVSKSGHRIMSTQFLINGHEANERDGLVKRVKERKQLLETILVDFKPLPGSKFNEWTANFDVVLGRTMQEMEDGSFGGGLGKPDGRG
jgi:protocatechuate 3,4-dioxygenase, beta subunit